MEFEETIDISSYASKLLKVEDDNTLHTIQDEMCERVLKTLSLQPDKLIKGLSTCSYIYNKLGTSLELRFIVPHLMDRGLMPEIGLKCVETTGYDLETLDSPVVRISSKTVKGSFHSSKNNGITKSERISNIVLGNTQGNTTRIPEFDAIMVIQMDPFLVCGIAPFYKVSPYIVEKSTGTDLRQVPFSLFNYVLHYQDRILPSDCGTEIKSTINTFVEDIGGNIITKCLKKFPENSHDPISKEEEF